MSKEQELLARIKELEIELQKTKKQKRYGLVWEDKPEMVVEECKQKLPVLIGDIDKTINDDLNGPIHILIEGDNYHALSVLAYTHEKQVDVIYIDPPYNTGNKDFIYNDTFIDRDDSFRHSKWLSFMSRRLELARRLLKDTGVIFISIDDNEVAQLRLLCNQIFEEKNFLAEIIIHANPKGRVLDKHFAKNHEYLLVFSRNIDSANVTVSKTPNDISSQFKEMDDGGAFRYLELRNTHKEFGKHNRPNLYYPFYIKSDGTITFQKTLDTVEVYPNWDDGFEGCWTWGLEKSLNEQAYLKAKFIKGRWKIYRKAYVQMDEENNLLDTKKLKTIWYENIFNTEKGKTLLTRVLGSNAFTSPKSIDIIKNALLCAPQDAIILDFFAGSGTTGHAVLDLNKEDGGKRQFILCTNNENKIAEEVTYPRIRNVIKGYTDVSGIPANLRYYRTDFIEVDKSIDDLRGRFMGRCTEMLQVRENTFLQFSLSKNGLKAGWERESEYFRVFQNTDKFLVVMYHPYEIETFKDWYEFLSEKENAPTHSEIVVYIFSMGGEIFEEELAHLSDHIHIETIPDEVLETYKKLFGF